MTNHKYLELSKPPAKTTSCFVSIFAQATRGNTLKTNFQMFARFSLRPPNLNNFVILNLRNFLFKMIVVCKSCSVGVSYVFFCGAPLQVFIKVIKLNSIFMIYLRFIFGIWNKRKSDETVDGKPFLFLATKNHRRIPVWKCFIFKNSLSLHSFPSTSAFRISRQTFHSPKIRDFVKRVALYFSPNFNHNVIGLMQTKFSKLRAAMQGGLLF